MKKQRHSFFLSGVMLLMMLFVAVGCSEDDGNSPSESNGITGLPADPGSGNLAGKIVGTIGGQAIIGATVSVSTKTTVTGSDGTFRLDGVGEGSLAVVVSGDSIYTRTAAINTADGRSVGINAIEVDSSFNLGFYREIARGNHPDEGDLYPTHRWTNSTPPTFYINTNASSTLDGVINQSTINSVRSVLNEVIPVFSGNFYTSIDIETRNFAAFNTFDDVPDNAFVISFDDSLADIGAYGITFTDPDFVSPTTSFINKTVLFLLDSALFYKNNANPSLISLEEIIAHETGHGMGFRHTSLLPSVMVRIGEFGGQYSQFDQLHMAITYQRSAGNTDIDNDPVAGAKMIGRFPGRQVFVDYRANFPKSPELMSQLQSLQSFGMVRDYIAENH